MIILYYRMKYSITELIEMREELIFKILINCITATPFHVINLSFRLNDFYHTASFQGIYLKYNNINISP